MTRVWSLATDEEPQQTQLFIMWKNEFNLFSFDSGYESATNSLSNDYIQDLEADQYNSIEEQHQHNDDDEEEVFETTNVSNTRAQSSPIPIPTNRKYKKSVRNHLQNSSPDFSTSSGYSSVHSSTSSSLSSQSLNNDLIGHPPCNCGCIRGYRNPYLVRNISLLTGRPSNSGKI